MPMQSSKRLQHHTKVLLISLRKSSHFHEACQPARCVTHANFFLQRKINEEFSARHRHVGLFTYGCVSLAGWCAIRTFATAGGALEDDAATSDGCTWRDLAGLLASSADSSTANIILFQRGSQVYSMWRQLYHPLFESVSNTTIRDDPQRSFSLAHEKVQSQRAFKQLASLKSSTSSTSLAASSIVRCIPEEAEELPLFVQALGELGRALAGHVHAATAASKITRYDEDDDALTAAEAAAWLSEVQSVLLYVGRHQLRFLLPRSFQPSTKHMCLNSQLSATSSDVDIGSSEGNNVENESATLFTKPSSLLAVKMESNVVSSQHHHAPPLRLISRVTGERLRDKAPPLPLDELLRVVVLVEAARTILDVAQPPATASGVRAELYVVLLSVVGASEQLTSSALASLTTCLARCVDSYATRQQLPPLVLPTWTGHARRTEAEEVKGESEQGVGEEQPSSGAPLPLCGESKAVELQGTLRQFYRPAIVTSSADGDSLVVRPSPMEEAEAQHLARHRGGLTQMLKPTEVLQQLSVIANVAQHRLAHTLYNLETERETSSSSDEGDWKEESTVALGIGRAGCARSASTGRVARQEEIQQGMLGLLSLQERKAREAAAAALPVSQKPKEGDSNTPKRQQRVRRTIAMIQAEAAAKRNAEMHHAATTPTAGEKKADERADSASSPSQLDEAAQLTANHCSSLPDELTDVATMTLTDVAELCTALAAMGYRGGGGGSAAPLDEPWWQLVIDFACGEIDSVADVRDACSRTDTAETRKEDMITTTSATTHAKAGTCDAPATGGEGSLEGMNEAMQVEAVVQTLMNDIRDVVFALDRVGSVAGYDKVMARLVKRGFLTSPIPPPSASARAMKDVK